jgi:hypothetical protein
LDNVVSTGRFFADLAQRLGPGTVVGGEDATCLARAFGMAIPPELVGANIETMGEGHNGHNGKHAETALAARANGRPQVVVTYPPMPPTNGDGTAELKFKKCFQVCKNVGSAKVCAEVCVDIDVGLGGVHGSITATVSVAF